MQAMEEELKMLRSGVAALLHRTTPVPGANAQLRRFCADLGRLLVASRPAGLRRGSGGHRRVGESRKWASHALCGAFLAGFWVEEHRRALGTRQRTFLGPLRGFAGFRVRCVETGCYPSWYGQVHW